MKVNIIASQRHGTMQYCIDGATDKWGLPDWKCAPLSSDPALQVSRLLKREIVSEEKAQFPYALPCEEGLIVTLED